MEREEERDLESVEEELVSILVVAFLLLLLCDDHRRPRRLPNQEIECG